MKQKKHSTKPVAIYKITNTKNGKVYIGQSVQPEIRWSNHRNCRSGGKENKLYRAIEKYGVEAFTFTIIQWCLNKHDADAVEKFLIETLNTRHAGYNIATGGQGFEAGELHPCYGKALTEEHKAKVSASSKGRKKSEETRQKMSAWQIGRKRSSETIERMSVSQKGKKQSAETIAKRVAKTKGQKRTQEQKARQAEGIKNMSPEAKERQRNVGRTMPREAVEKTAAAHRGTKRSPETCQKMKDAWVERRKKLMEAT